MAGSEGEESKLMGIQELVESGLHAVPFIYVRPPHERPDILPLAATHLQSCIPVIDLAHLHDHDDDVARTTLLQELGCACQEWGFFQVVNHGIESGVIQGLREAALKFFTQPAQERNHLFTSQRFDKPVLYTTSFNPSQEKVREWRDTLSFIRFPGTFDGTQQAPDICRKEVQEYIGEVEALGRRVYRAIFESIGLGKEYIEEAVPEIPRMRMSINYYPPCPDPSLTLGLSGHSDVSCLTVLHPGDVPGLQIKHKGTWVPVFPIDPSAFVINLADQIEILTNGKYKSIEHRVVTNEEKPRMSIACFFGPLEDTIVAPLPKLLNENNPPHYKSTKFKDYFENFTSNRLQSNRGTLDFARV